MLGAIVSHLKNRYSTASTQMHLLILNHEFPPAGGGAANASLEIARALVDLGDEPVVVTSRHPAGSKEIADLPFPCHLVSPERRKLESGTIFEMLRYIPSAILASQKLHRDSAFDGCIAFFSIPAGAAAYALKFLCNIPYIVLLRGGDVPGNEPQLHLIHQILSPLRRSIYRNARHVAANSDGLRKMAMNADPGFDIGVIPNGVDTEFFRPSSSPPPAPPFRILFVGRLNPQKNVHLLIEALHQLGNRLGDSIARLDIVGDGPERQKLERLASSLGVANRLTFHGWLDKAKLLACYHSAHVFVNPSAYEGMPNTVLEAMACGLTVVASGVAGNRDLLQGRPNAFLLGEINAHRLSDLLCQVINSLGEVCNRSACGSCRGQVPQQWKETAKMLTARLAANE